MDFNSQFTDNLNETTFGKAKSLVHFCEKSILEFFKKLTKINKDLLTRTNVSLLH